MEKEGLKKEYQKITEQITKKELEMEKLETSNRLIHSTIEDFRHTLKRGFQELSWIHNEAQQNGELNKQIESQHDEEEARQFFHYLQLSEEEARQEFHKNQQILESERDALYKRRSEYTWD